MSQTDQLRLIVECGAATQKLACFLPGAATGSISLGSAGAWRLSGTGVAAFHGYLYFDGERLYVSSCRPEAPVVVNRLALPEGWRELQHGAVLQLGQARLRTVRGSVDGAQPMAPPNPIGQGPPPQHFRIVQLPARAETEGAATGLSTPPGLAGLGARQEGVPVPVGVGRGQTLGVGRSTSSTGTLLVSRSPLRSPPGPGGTAPPAPPLVGPVPLQQGGFARGEGSGVSPQPHDVQTDVRGRGSSSPALAVARIGHLEAGLRQLGETDLGETDLGETGSKQVRGQASVGDAWALGSGLRHGPERDSTTAIELAGKRRGRRLLKVERAADWSSSWLPNANAPPRQGETGLEEIDQSHGRRPSWLPRLVAVTLPFLFFAVWWGWLGGMEHSRRAGGCLSAQIGR